MPFESDTVYFDGNLTDFVDETIILPPFLFFSLRARKPKCRRRKDDVHGSVGADPLKVIQSLQHPLTNPTEEYRRS